MRKLVISVIVGMGVLLLSAFIYITINYNKQEKQVTYRLVGGYTDQQEQYFFDGFVMRNYKDILLTYTLEIPYSDKEINYIDLYYMKNNEKNVVLGGSGLSKYHFENIGSAKKDYGNSVGLLILQNYLDDLYADLYLNYEDYENQNVYKTIKIDAKKLG